MHTNVIQTNKRRTHAQSNYTNTKLKACFRRLLRHLARKREWAYSTAPWPTRRIRRHRDTSEHETGVSMSLLLSVLLTSSTSSSSSKSSLSSSSSSSAVPLPRRLGSSTVTVVLVLPVVPVDSRVLDIALAVALFCGKVISRGTLGSVDCWPAPAKQFQQSINQSTNLWTDK